VVRRARDFTLLREIDGKIRKAHKVVDVDHALAAFDARMGRA